MEQGREQRVASVNINYQNQNFWIHAIYIFPVHCSRYLHNCSTSVRLNFYPAHFPLDWLKISPIISLNLHSSNIYIFDNYHENRTIIEREIREILFQSCFEKICRYIELAKIIKFHLSLLRPRENHHSILHSKISYHPFKIHRPLDPLFYLNNNFPVHLSCYRMWKNVLKNK